MKAQLKELGGWFANNAYGTVGTASTQKQYKKRLKKLKADYGINKSYIPGQGWMKATQVPKGVLRRAVERPYGSRAGTHAKMNTGFKYHTRGKPFEVRHEYRQGQKDLKDAVAGVPFKKMPSGALRGEASRGEMGALGAFAFRTGGKNGTRNLVVGTGHPSDTAAKFETHEMAHLGPKRSSYRLHQIATDPVKAMREEARADHVAGMNWKNPVNNPSGYSQAARDRNAAAINQRRLAGTPREDMFKEPALNAYRNTQDRLGNLGVPQHKPENAPAKGQSKVKRHVLRHRDTYGYTALGAASGAAGGIYGARKHKRDQNGKFSSSGIAKSSPDSADLHVMGSGASKTRAKGKLRPCYPKSIRKV